MKKLITVILLTCTTLSVTAQKKKNHFPIWTYHQDSVNVIGISVGISDFLFEKEYTSTQGLKLALLGEGILAFAIPSSPICDSDSELNVYAKEPDSKVNGIYISGTGSLLSNNVNGILLGGMAQHAVYLNGISASLMHNFSQVHNGALLGLVSTEAYKARGVQVAAINMCKNLRGLQIGGRNENRETKGMQVGIWNKSMKTTGLQLGLWNVNEHRSLPFINWGIKQKEA